MISTNYTLCLYKSKILYAHCCKRIYAKPLIHGWGDIYMHIDINADRHVDIGTDRASAPTTNNQYVGIDALYVRKRDVKDYITSEKKTIILC